MGTFKCSTIPVCIPNETPIPRISKKRAKGANPGGAGVFPESKKDNTEHMRTAEVKNSEKKAETFVM
jgi:hypothetical protein